MLATSGKTMSIVCNRCDVPVGISDTADDQTRVACVVCGADFGTWGDIRSEMCARVGQPFRDRDSWRTVER